MSAMSGEGVSPNITILADVATESWLWDTSIRVFAPFAKIVVSVHRYQLRVLRGFNAIGMILYAVPMYFLLLKVADLFLKTMGDLIGIICIILVGIAPLYLCTTAYQLLDAVYAQVAAEEEVFPDYDNTGRPFNEMGVELSVLLEFVQQCGGAGALAGLSTSDVCERFLKPMTAAAGSSYCDYLLTKRNAGGDVRVRNANVFISHAWRCDFLTVVDAITLHLSKEGPEVVIWFDLFSNNQHGLDAAPPFGWWCHTFLNAIKNIGRTVMVIQPWDDPITLTRAWCLWELFCTARTKSRFEIAMSGPERQRFTDSVAANPDLFLGMVSRVDAERSQAWNPDDQTRIHEVVELLVGFKTLNRLVVSCLRNWYISLLEDMVRTSKTSSFVPGPTVLHLQVKSLGMLYHEEGLYAAAETVLTEYETICAAQFAGDILLKLQAAHLLAKAALAQGQYAVAGSTLNKCITECCNDTANRSMMTTNDPQVKLECMRMLLTLARVYILADQPQLAASVLRDLDIASQGCPGYTAADAAWYQIEYADVYISLHPADADADSDSDANTDTIQKLLDNCRESVAFLSQHLGQDHPHTLEGSRRLGVLLLRGGGGWGSGSGPEEALPLLQGAFDMLSVKLGSGHPGTLTAMHSLGKYYLLTSPRMALKLFEKCRKGRITALGKLHPSTLDIIFDVFALSDYAPLGLLMSLIALCATAAFFALEVSILDGFVHGIDAFSSSEQSVLLGMTGSPLFFLLTMPFYDSSIQMGLRRPRDIPFRVYWIAVSLAALAFVGGVFSLQRVVERRKEYINILYYILSVYAGFAAGIALSLPAVKMYDIHYIKPARERRAEVLRWAKRLGDDSDGKASYRCNSGDVMPTATTVEMNISDTSGRNPMIGI